MKTRTLSAISHVVLLLLAACSSRDSAPAADDTGTISADLSVRGTSLNDVLPIITGTAREQETLLSDVGSWRWSDAAAVRYWLQWLRCDSAGEHCAEVAGATESSYTLTAADVGMRMRARVRANVDIRVAAVRVSDLFEATSAPTEVVRHAAPVNTSLPTLSGVAHDGEQLTADPGTWSGYVSGFEYAWLRCDAAGASCQPIGATGSTYVLVSADVGSTVRVEVTALGDDISASATSNPSDVVAAVAPSAVGAPSISGSLVSGELLTASGPTFNGTTPITVSHQWIRCFPNIDACSEVAGATEATYRLQTADVGMVVRVRVTASNGAGTATLASPVSGLIAPRTLVADDFDSGNSVGQLPAGWISSRPTDTRLEVVSHETVPAQTPPFSVLLRDDSTAARPELQRKFPAPASAGSATVRVRLDNLNHAPMGLQLRSDKGTFLAAAVLGANGVVGHDVGAGTVSSTARWSPGTWYALRIQWFADRTFDAYLGGAKFAERVSFGVAADPAQIIVTSGYGAVTGRQVYVDSISVEEMPLVDDFEVGAVGTRPPGWSIPAASGLSFKLVDGTSLAARGQAVELRDDSTASRAEMTRSFVATRQGSLSLKAQVPNTASAPFDIHLRGATDAFLVALRLGNDGKLAFNANPGGSGAFTVTPALWTAGAWNDVRIDWFQNGTFDAYLNGTRVIAGVRMGASIEPARVKVIVGTGPVAGRVGYVDSLAVTRAVPLETIRGRYTENATFLAHAYVMSQRYIDLVPTLCQKMSEVYGVPYLYVNIGLVQPNGYLPSTTTSRYMVTQFLNAIDTCETTLGVKFHVVAWINGHTEDGAGVPLVDVTQAATRQAMVQESARFVSAAEPGSYVAAARRTFDGIQFDLEPSGGDSNRFNHFKQLMTEVRQRFTELGVPEKSIGFDAHKLANGTNEWWWTSQQYYEMAQVVDQLIAMTYSTGYTDGPTYQQFMEDQVRDILRAVSGEAWGNDAAHPAPWNRVKVFAGFIAMAPSKWHVPEAENIEFGAPGADAALTALINAGSRGPEFFQGAAVYLHADGTGNDGFAGYDTDWWDFGHLWLGAW